MRIDLFRMERTQCLYENQVDFNLSESGVLPLRLDEILDGNAAEFLSQGLKYPESEGSELLRERIAKWYGTTSDHVLVTNGGSEANFTALWGMLDRPDHAAVMLPNYLQSWGLSRAFAGKANAFYLTEQKRNGAARWGLDVDSLRKAVRKRTSVIVVTNPNNPTGAVLTEEEMDEVIRAARRANAWILADEIYRGAELHGPMTPTFWGRYDKVLVSSGLSKAFGAPGLRIGWLVGSPKQLAKLCAYHDYTTLTPTLVSDRLARIMMEPARREAILERTRSIVQRNLPKLETWIHSHDDLLEYIPPVAGAITYVRYRLPISSEKLFDKLRTERSVLITPGDHFGGGKYIRIGYGYDVDYTLRGLERVDQTFAELKKKKAAARASTAKRGAA